MITGPWTAPFLGPWPLGSLAQSMHKSVVHAQEISCVYTRDSFVYTQLCETMRNYAKLCKTMRNYAKLRETTRFSQICRKLDTQFRTNVSICTRLRIESSLPEFARPARGAGGARGNGVTESCSDPPSHTRRGLGLREFHKLPQKRKHGRSENLCNSMKGELLNTYPSYPIILHSALVAASAVALNQSASRLSHSTMTSETVDQRALLEVIY